MTTYNTIEVKDMEMSNKLLTPSQAAQLREAVKEMYSAISHQAHGVFPYLVGQESLARLGYAPEWLAVVPSEILERFVGVGNPFSIRTPLKGESVLDVGCGCGLDTFVAAGFVGLEGYAVGLDLTPEMLEWPRKALANSDVKHINFVEASVEALPFDDSTFDLVISNGALNLVPDKETAFKEVARVLRPKGEFVAADLIVVETIPEPILACMDAWSS